MSLAPLTIGQVVSLTRGFNRNKLQWVLRETLALRLSTDRPSD